jgi:UrcA family protein
MTKSFALILIAAGAGVGIASAQPPVTVYGPSAPSARVSYADINLASSKGVAALQNRVRAAASDLCLEPVKEDLSIATARATCYRTAIHDGFTQIDRLVSERMAGRASMSSAILISAR